MRRTWGVVGGIIGILGLLWIVLVAAPPWFVHDRSLEGLKAQNEVRTTLLQGLGGVVLLMGAYFTFRQVMNSREQLQIAQQGQITERFTRAIDQLGHAHLDVRLGGIYSLERIARDSPADRATIGEVLTAFIRGHAPLPPELAGEDATASIDDVPELQVRAPDVQACLTVLGRAGFARVEEGWAHGLDLHELDLRRADLRGAHLEGANFAGVHLEEASLLRAHLEDANLVGAHLSRASLFLAHLEDADLVGADLGGAVLNGAHLERTNLAAAYLGGAYLTSAHLERANLAATDLEGADLFDAHLEGATATNGTDWPEEYDWRAAGVIVSGEDTAANGP